MKFLKIVFPDTKTYTVIAIVERFFRTPKDHTLLEISTKHDSYPFSIFLLFLVILIFRMTCENHPLPQIYESKTITQLETSAICIIRKCFQTMWNYLKHQTEKEKKGKTVTKQKQNLVLENALTK